MVLQQTPSSSLGERSGDRSKETELEPPRTSGDPVTSKETSEVSHQLGDKGSVQSENKRVDDRVLEISDSSLEDQRGSVGGARDPESTNNDMDGRPPWFEVTENEWVIPTEEQTE